MRSALCLVLLPAALLAESKWIQSRSGPVEIYSDAGNKIALEKLNFFEQFRFALGTLVGKPDLNAEPPIRLLVVKNPTLPSALMPGRDRISIPIAADRPIPPSVLKSATKLLLEQNVPRLSPGIEKGLEDFFSTVEVKGAHVIWGDPPPASERNLDWARIQLLATKPEYYGKLRILLFNLQKGIADEPAYRNAIGKSKKEFDIELEAYFKAGVFSSSDGPGRAFSAQRDLPVKALDAGDVDLAMADLLNGDSRAGYERMIQNKKHFAEANEGLAMLALRDHDEAAALKYLIAATDADSKSPAAWLAYAKLETDRPRSNDALEHALELDPKLAEAHYLLGDRKHDLEELKKATTLNPRQWEYWNSLGDVYLDDNKFPEAAKAYREAEHAAADPKDQERMHAAWSRVEGEKLDYQGAEKKRAADDEREELERLKAKALADLHASESKINKRLGGSVPDKVISWEEAGLPVMLEGALRQVDCLGKDTRVVIEGPDKKMFKLSLKDRGKLVCGAQDGRHVSVEYTPKPDAKLGTAGELAAIPETN
jgi:tetratricopeptide (TPR) repeat protein